MNTAPSSDTVVTSNRARPGWPEIFAGAATYVVGLLVVSVTLPLVENAAIQGIVAFFISGALGLLAFAVAALIRIRALRPFGFRRAAPSKVLVGAGLGVVAYLLGVLAAIIYVTVTGDAENVQGSYQASAAGGALSLTLALVTGALLTPLGEEAFFRGVLANALLQRYRAWIAVVVSAAIFALAHGINPVLPVAFVVGVLTALLFRWSGSIWPGVALHGMNNATALIVPLVLGVTTG